MNQRQSAFDRRPLLARISGVFHRGPGETQIEESRVTADRLREMMQRGESIILVDIRHPWEHEDGHIPGSISIPHPRTWGTDLHSLVEGGTIVVYCTAGVRSMRARKTISSMGAKKVVDLAGGIRAWEEAGGETVTTASFEGA